jgi:hypothetical protein
VQNVIALVDGMNSGCKPAGSWIRSERVAHRAAPAAGLDAIRCEDDIGREHPHSEGVGLMGINAERSGPPSVPCKIRRLWQAREERAEFHR